MQFSNKARKGNTQNETFHVSRLIVLSETTAAVVYSKEPTKKKAVAWFYYLNSHAKPRWEYFFVTYQHLVGLDRVGDLLFEVEQHNFSESIFDGD